MTPFMWRVQELLDGGPESSPQTEPSDEVSVAEGADTQVIIRSLAEQLVSEANAVLAWHDGGGPGGELTLIDETGPGALSFTLGFGARRARIQTVISGHTATASLVTEDGGDAPRRLTDEEQVQDLVLELLSRN
ncbi:hypothetical protein WKY82_04855 [Gordonia malaquae]|jgi:hypothetical protein|uniref:hypothetical protein n=1 Tax=Gordonia TaxID=2053 RepID=UPI00301867F3